MQQVKSYFFANIHQSQFESDQVLKTEDSYGVGHTFANDVHFVLFSRSRISVMKMSAQTCLVSLLTAPGKTTYSTAFITIGRLDLDTGSRNSFAETEQRKKTLECSSVFLYQRFGSGFAWIRMSAQR